MWVTCPTETVPFVIGLADVLDVGAVTDGAVTTEYGYDGLKRRNEAGVSTLIGGGFDGNHGSRTDGTLPVLISFIDTSPFHDHAGYCEDSSPCALGDGNGDGLADHINKRHLRNMTCTSTSCAENTCTLGNPAFCYTIETSPTHIDTILNVAVASIEQGQVPAIPGTNDRIARSGASKEAEFYVYYATGSTTLARAEAVAEAIDDSDTTADIISLSLGFFPDQCDPTDDMAGLRALLPLVTNMGVLFVAAVGNQENESNTTACTVDSTMGRPGLLSVGAVDSSNSSASLSQLVRANYSAVGGMPIVVNGTTYQTSSLGLLSFGGDVTLSSGDGFQEFQDPSPDPSDVTTGTSFASPFVSGSLADVIDMRHSNHGSGDWVHNPRKLMAGVYVLADRYDGTAASNRKVSGTSALSGYGRFRVIKEGDTALLGSANGWEAGVASVVGSGDACVQLFGTQLPSSVTQFKVAAFWEETGNMSNAADIQLKMRDACSCPLIGQKFGGTVKASDTTKNLTKMVNSFDMGGRCVQLQLDTQHNPSTRTVYYAYLYHSGTTQFYSGAHLR